MSLPGFHPFVEQWFTDALGAPTETQLAGWAAIRRGRHTLIAAPTGSGKTLAAFLVALDDLAKEALAGELPDEVRVVYVSPLKALSADIHKNLAEPRRGIRRIAEEVGRTLRITAAVRTGDTSSSERAAMLRRPPHILVTTPESLYLLVTADRSRQMLRTVRTLIVDEIHAVIGTRRGAHLALSIERLQHVAERPLVRLGLSATQKPVERVARFLTGASDQTCEIIDQGHRRRLDLGVELPQSTLDAVMSSEVWEEYYDRLAALIEAHRTTLIFVNTRRMAERIARHLTDRLGERAVTAHHGSLSKEKRLDAEMRLKGGQLRALVATASLELGIDIGHVDLVCQIGSPHRISTFLQRVGRSGHTIAGLPKGRLFPVSRDDLVEGAALLRAVGRGELDAIVAHDAPLDVLAQQIVAESACRTCAEEDLFALFRRAAPYRTLQRTEFDAIVTMLAEGFSTRRGRRGALVHRDEVNRTLRARRGTRLLAQTSGGAIPETADYRVVLDPENIVIGTLNEDFAIESSIGDVFQLGNASWRVLQVVAGTVRVADAKGAPPTIPFWLGEAPARSTELSQAVSELREQVDSLLSERATASSQRSPRDKDHQDTLGDLAIANWLISETGLSLVAAEQIIEYLNDGRATLGVIPTQQTLVLERFFDESGGMQLVLHAPFGSRINRAWCLALRKRFCRQFNFELQAAATEDALLLSLGPQHSFPLADVFRYLHPESTRDVLVQALLDAPVFPTRWRWNMTISLAVPRNRGGRRIPPQLQRMLADDLMAAVFPDAAACLENIPGDRAIPDHPLVQQTIRDCLHEAMDFDGLRDVLARIHAGELRLVARDTPEPSCFAHDILNAKPYAFLDDAPLEERRAHAVQTRRAGQPSHANDLGVLDPAAIVRVRDEVRPNPRDDDELHDALVVTGFLTSAELTSIDPVLLERLMTGRRACRVDLPPFENGGAPRSIWMAAERLPEILAIHSGVLLQPAIQPPASRTTRTWSREEAVAELLRGRFTVTGPVTVPELADSLALGESEINAALLALESDGVVLRGHFDPEPVEGSLQWCDRALLARIHRYTLNRLRAEIEPVSPADFMRFLLAWQHIEPSSMLAGTDGLREVLAQLDGCELPAAAWERYVLPMRIADFHPQMLDMLCMAGEISWGRFSRAMGDAACVPRLVPATPIAIFLRHHRLIWSAPAQKRDTHTYEDVRKCECPPSEAPASGPEPALPESARRVLDILRRRGASFFTDLSSMCELDTDETTRALGTLVAAGLAVSDGFSGLRALIWAARGRQATRTRRIGIGGRWSAVPLDLNQTQDDGIETQAWCFLRRYGVVFRRVLMRESNAATWRELARVYRRLEARGEIRGGRFVSGMSGEQFALPEAVERLREVRRTAPDGRFIALSTADPLNLAGIVTAGDRVRVAARSRVAYRDGVPLAVREGDSVRALTSLDENTRSAAEATLRRRTRSLTASLVSW